MTGFTVLKAYGKITNSEENPAFNSYQNYQNEAEIFKLRREFGTSFNDSKNNQKHEKPRKYCLYGVLLQYKMLQRYNSL